MSNVVNIELPVEHVSDTAWLVAEMRAMESERSDAHFKDPLARKLVGDKGKSLMKLFEGIWDSEVLMTVRTSIIDEAIRDLVAKGVDTVLNLAAGLDTRPYRLKLPETLRWIEVDYPALIQYKNTTLANDKPVCKLERLSVDLSNDEARFQMLRDVASTSKQVLVLTEGLLSYLTEANVVALALNLQKQASIKYWMMDVMDQSAMAWMHEKLAQRVTHLTGKTPIRFAAKNGTAFFEPLGWRQSSFQSFMDKSRQINRAPTGEWAGLASEFMEKSGIALLTRAQ